MKTFLLFAFLLLPFVKATATPADSLELQKVTIRDTMLIKAARHFIKKRGAEESIFRDRGIVIATIASFSDSCITYHLRAIYSDVVLRIELYGIDRASFYGEVDGRFVIFCSDFRLPRLVWTSGASKERAIAEMVERGALRKTPYSTSGMDTIDIEKVTYCHPPWVSVR